MEIETIVFMLTTAVVGGKFIKLTNTIHTNKDQHEHNGENSPAS